MRGRARIGDILVTILRCDVRVRLSDARKSRVGMWMYGDSVGDDAKEFGMGNVKKSKAAEEKKEDK